MAATRFRSRLKIIQIEACVQNGHAFNVAARQVWPESTFEFVFSRERFTRNRRKNINGTAFGVINLHRNKAPNINFIVLLTVTLTS